MEPAPVLRSLLVLALVLVCGGCASLAIHDPPPAPDLTLSRCEPETADRLRFLESQLASNARYADRWWWLWNGVHGGGIVAGAAMAAVENGRGKRADGTVGALKATIGLTQNLLAPPVAREGVKGLRAIQTDRPDGCSERLAAAEELLRDAARDAHEERRGWLSHAGNLAINLIGALVVAEGFDEGSGWSSGALGLVVGEVQIWSYPWQAEAMLEEYERRFPRTAGAAPHWRTELRDERLFLVLD